MSGLAVDQNNRHSREQQSNLEMEQQVGPKYVIHIAHVGARADRLSSYYNYYNYTIGKTVKPLPELR
uniref:hypothetical protein n=1 Tax=Granulicella tundricola TaxID=940615 RepID=UPI0018DCA949|nr:hypothetical protein [Granulicella tundricola]